MMAMDAIQLLKKDHEKVKALLSELADTTKRATKKRQKLLERIHTELEAHTTIEEEIFYPAFKKAGAEKDDDEMYFEAKEEHRAVDELVMPDLAKTDTSSAAFSGRVKVLKELVEHHAEEEEKEMFPRARKLLSTDQLKDIGSQMERRKKEILGSAKG